MRISCAPEPSLSSRTIASILRIARRTRGSYLLRAPVGAGYEHVVPALPPPPAAGRATHGGRDRDLVDHRDPVRVDRVPVDPGVVAPSLDPADRVVLRRARDEFGQRGGPRARLDLGPPPREELAERLARPA